MTELAYPIAQLFPPQGQWSDEDYLLLETNKLIELSEGRLEVLYMPSDWHQVIVGRIFVIIVMFLEKHHLGRVRTAPLRVKLWPNKFREPDVMFMSTAHLNRIHEDFWGPPDLAVEVISPDDPDRDRVRKKAEYAQAGIQEYWIVDPEAKTVEVYSLPPAAREYQLTAAYANTATLQSLVLNGLALPLADLFAPEE